MILYPTERVTGRPQTILSEPEHYDINSMDACKTAKRHTIVIESFIKF